MAYFVTGATGFIGRFLVANLLRRGQPIYVLVRKGSVKKLDGAARAQWGADDKTVIGVVGDLAKPNLGVAAADLKKLKGKIDHFFHLAAIYDLKASAEEQQIANVDGTRHAVQLRRKRSSAGCFHHVSSIAAAGLYDGMFREDMFDEAEDLDHPYFKTKHDSEGSRAPRMQAAVPHLPSGIRRRRFEDRRRSTRSTDRTTSSRRCRRCARCVPPWMPMLGIEGGRINIVPVDFVADALDYLAHKKGLDGKCFHLTDPEPHRIGEVLNIFAKAGHAPQMTMRINAKMFGFIPAPILYGLGSLAPIKRTIRVVLTDLGIPQDVFQFINWPTRYDNREAAKALKGSGIEVPPLDDATPRSSGITGSATSTRIFSSTARSPAASRTRSSSSPARRRASARRRRSSSRPRARKVILVARGEEKLLETKAGDRGRGRPVLDLHRRRRPTSRPATRSSRAC